MGEWPMKGPFDFMFCRNVLIYFDKETKEMLAKRYGELLASKSYLFIGHSESLHQLSTDFDLIGNTIYQKV
jgi:chemotaxis protein methyltransferase CheR